MYIQLPSLPGVGYGWFIVLRQIIVHTHLDSLHSVGCGPPTVFMGTREESVNV